MDNIDIDIDQTAEDNETLPAKTEKGSKSFWRNLLRTILGTTISILLTFGTNALKAMPDAKYDVIVNPDKYEGSTLPMKMMHSKRVRTDLGAIHNRRCWLRYAAASLRYFNLQNMAAIGIAEQEVMKYTDAREKKGEDVGTPPNANTFYTRAYTLDSLTSLTRLTERIEELKAERQ